MASIAAIRTNRWTEEEERLLARLRAAFGADVAVVFHDRPAGVAPPAPVIDINAGWVAAQGLALVPDWGWRCGDYFYYALRAARPGHDAYWLVEPDVYFTAEPVDFFHAFDDVTHDGLGYGLGPFPADHRFARGLGGLAPWRAIFALTRFSGVALDRLLALRRAAAAGPVSQRDYPNDELFAFSHLAADPAMTLGRLEDVAPDWFHGVQFATDPDLLVDLLQPGPSGGRIYHPVRGRAAFVAALARRMAGNAGVAQRMRWQVAALSEAEVEAVAAATAEITRQMLQGLRARAARRGGRMADADGVADTGTEQAARAAGGLP
jgi:hypothetical protein